jgi:GNAT superfamily N-acetyltransferase
LSNDRARRLTGLVRIERIDAADLDRDTATEMTDVTNAEDAVANPEAVAQSVDGLRLRIRHGFDDRPHEALWTVRSDEGALAGWGSLELPHWDNPQLALVFCNVHPDARGQGIGTMLLDAQVTAATEHGRSSLLTFGWKDSHATQFLLSNGFTVGQQTAMRRLEPKEADVGTIARLAAEATEKAADYELVWLEGPASPEMLPELQVLFEAINDAPLDDVSVEPDFFPVERIEGYQRAMVARHQHLYRLLARHRRTGDWAGHTILCVDETRPGYAFQEDTTVREEHRGHRLGMLLKATMLLWMRDAQPALETIDTWNAVSNRHMIAVNEALGCRVAGLGVALQRAL